MLRGLSDDTDASLIMLDTDLSLREWLEDDDSSSSESLATDLFLLIGLVVVVFRMNLK